MNSPDSPETFSRTLAEWRVTPPRNPNFRPEVWARIRLREGYGGQVAASRPAPSWTGYLRAHGALVAGALALAVALGAWSGHAEARAHDEAARANLVASYVHGLDARWMRLP
jgi:hypothetical protein